MRRARAIAVTAFVLAAALAGTRPSAAASGGGDARALEAARTLRATIARAVAGGSEVCAYVPFGGGRSKFTIVSTSDEGVRGRVAGATAWTESSADRAEDAVVFAPGETIAWVFRPAATRDVIPPSVRIVSPMPNATVAGPIEVRVEASDDKGVARVEASVDATGAVPVSGPPYRFTVKTDGMRRGVWSGIAVVASDAAGNASEARLMIRVAE